MPHGGVTMTDPQVLTVPQVAAQLQMTEEAVRDLLRSGSLRGSLPGGRKLGWRVRPTDLERFLDDTANRPTTEA